MPLFFLTLSVTMYWKFSQQTITVYEIILTYIILFADGFLIC